MKANEFIKGENIYSVYSICHSCGMKGILLPDETKCPECGEDVVKYYDEETVSAAIEKAFERGKMSVFPRYSNHDIELILLVGSIEVDYFPMLSKLPDDFFEEYDNILPLIDMEILSRFNYPKLNEKGRHFYKFLIS